MEPIHRSKGATPSEVFLAELADRTFLDLWSYPNIFFRPGKELCDLLVVFGDDVIIFSDKSIAWGPADVRISWPRWYKRAVEKSASQIRGAERALRERPEDVFLDPACKHRLPLDLPPLERRRIHGVCVAFGAEDACNAYFGGEDSALMILPELKGREHSAPDQTPFMIGDVDPSGPFVHVFDRTSLEVVMKEMSTISEFVQYLRKRADFIRSQRLLVSPSEADMVANYLQITRESGEHDFPQPHDFGEDGEVKITFCEGEYEALLSSEEYRAREVANKVSYVWDGLISEFTQHLIAGTSAKITEDEPSAKHSEPALRFMASEDRTSRRALGAALIDALKTAESRGEARFARVIMPNTGMSDPELAYVILVLAYPQHLSGSVDYEKYRKVRVAMLKTYCEVVIFDNENCKRAVGIAMDASQKVTGRAGGSEELVAIEVSEWSDEAAQNLAERREHYDVLNKQNLTMSGISIQEFPDLGQGAANSGSRQQRRAAERQARKARVVACGKK